ncbi:MAG: cytochrome c3 family protein, partial [Planctomycetota bacterium]
GVTAVESNNPAGSKAGRNSMADSGRNHPIGVSYADRVRQTSASALRPVALLPQEVRLPDGKVSCVSCHSLYAGRPNLLTVPIEKSQLCFACHQMN